MSSAREKDGQQEQEEKESSAYSDANYSTSLANETGCQLLEKNCRHKEETTYPVLGGASVLKAPVATLLIVTVWLTADVLVEVVVGSSSGILLNDMAMLDKVW